MLQACNSICFGFYNNHFKPKNNLNEDFLKSFWFQE